MQVGDSDACCEAPEGTIAPEGTELQTLEMMPGWYRHTPYSAEVLPCRYAFECEGWSAGNLTTRVVVDTTGTVLVAVGNLNINTSTVSAGEYLCADGYTGPMCG